MIISQKKRILFFVTEDWYFSMHFQHFAVAAIKNGWEVDLICNTGQKGHDVRNDIERSGINLIPCKLSRSGITPFQDLKALLRLLKIVRKRKPCVIHAVALKPILFCNIASLVTQTPLIAMITGLGHVFTGSSIKARLAKPVVTAAMKSVSRNVSSKLVVLNNEDADWVCQNFSASQTGVSIIPGTGVDLARFSPAEKIARNCFRVAYVGRMLTEKGIFDLIEAIKILKKDSFDLELFLAGEPDPSNPASIDISQLQKWEKEKLCKYLGHSKNIETIYQQIDVLILPSYREGLGMTIIEAASTGIPSIATDVPGCRSAVINGKTGLLVPSGQPEKIADAIKYLIRNPEIRMTMGENARKFVEENFSQGIVINKVLSLYSELSRKT